MLLLRPHHINCIFFYKGLGYSEEFIAGMNHTLDLLKKNPHSKIKLAIKCDTLCSNCPNKQNNDACTTLKTVEELDYKTLLLYNLNEDEEYMFSEIINSIYRNYDITKFHSICCNCNWYKHGTCNENIIKEQSESWIIY